MADRRKRLHRDVIEAIPRDRGRVADTVVPSLSIIEQMAERPRTGAGLRADQPGRPLLRAAVGGGASPHDAGPLVLAAGGVLWRGDPEEPEVAARAPAGVRRLVAAQGQGQARRAPARHGPAGGRRGDRTAGPRRAAADDGALPGRLRRPTGRPRCHLLVDAVAGGAFPPNREVDRDCLAAAMPAARRDSPPRRTAPSSMPSSARAATPRRCCWCWPGTLRPRRPGRRRWCRAATGLGVTRRGSVLEASASPTCAAPTSSLRGHARAVRAATGLRGAPRAGTHQGRVRRATRQRSPTDLRRATPHQRDRCGLRPAAGHHRPARAPRPQRRWSARRPRRPCARAAGGCCTCATAPSAPTSDTNPPPDGNRRTHGAMTHLEIEAKFDAEPTGSRCPTCRCRRQSTPPRPRPRWC